MRKLEITNNLTRKFGKMGLQVKKYSPEILAVVGITGTVASAVMACKATMKCTDILDEMKDDMSKIHQVAEMSDVDYSEQDMKKDTVIVYTQTAVKFAKLYGPSVVLGTFSLSCILASNNILRKRNVALTAAYAAVDRSFKEYRNNVVERFGEELDKELRYNVKAKTFEEIVKDEETGKEKTVKTTVNVAEPSEYSEYARVFDEYCTGWTKDHDYNKMILQHQQNHANEILKAKGYLFLNDVYEMLGFPKTKTGFIVGWYYDEKAEDSDNYVDFGIYDFNREKVRDFFNGYERSIILDFNVQGNILELM